MASEHGWARDSTQLTHVTTCTHCRGHESETSGMYVIRVSALAEVEVRFTPRHLLTQMIIIIRASAINSTDAVSTWC